MRLWNWILEKIKGSAKPTFEEGDGDYYPRVEFSISISMDGTFRSFMEWPFPDTAEDRDLIVKYAATMLHLLLAGKMYPAVQEAVATAGMRDDMSGMGQLILHRLAELRDEEGYGSDNVVVDAETVFSKVNG